MESEKNHKESEEKSITNKEEKSIKSDHNNEINKLKGWFNEEIKRRDKIIDELRKENTILLKTAIKKSESTLDKENVRKSENR